MGSEATNARDVISHTEWVGFAQGELKMGHKYCQPAVGWEEERLNFLHDLESNLPEALELVPRIHRWRLLQRIKYGTP